MPREWDELDAQAAREGALLKRAFRRSRTRDGSSKVNPVDHGHDYRIRQEEASLIDVLTRDNVIDGRPT